MRRSGILGFLLTMALTASAVCAQSETSWKTRQLIYGPLMLALSVGYHRWVDGPLGGKAPDASSFQVLLDASHEPYTVYFSRANGSSVPNATYMVSESSVLNASLPPVPDSYEPKYPKGPITLSGAYVKAFLAANAAHAATKKSLGDDYAYVNAPGSGVVLVTVPERNGDVLVGFAQKVVETGPTRHIGCYKEQYFLVETSGFKAESTRLGCPGQR